MRPRRSGSSSSTCRSIPVDSIASSAHKLGGPKGVGALVLRSQAAIRPFLLGGGQERGQRGGTENVIGIAGYGAACRVAARTGSSHGEAMRRLRDRLWRGIEAEIDGVRWNGDPARTLPNTLNVEFAGVAGEVLLQALDLEGVSVSAGAACHSGSIEPSKVLLAMGRTPDAGAGEPSLLPGPRRRRGPDRAHDRAAREARAAHPRAGRAVTGAAAPERVVVAMSGGVDSSLAAALVVASGAETIGVTMRLSASGSRCCSLEDADDARKVAERLGIRFYVANYAEAFGREVIETFADAYLAGRTPIPCIACNQRFKFDHLLERAKAFGASRVATGHYARIEHDPASGRARLFRARHREKDQSYFLFSLRQEQLREAHFPVGEMSKEEVRREARALGLATAEKPESQEICFVPDGDYAKVVERLRPEAAKAEGVIVDEAGPGPRTPPRHPPLHRRPAPRPRHRLRSPALRRPPRAREPARRGRRRGGPRLHAVPGSSASAGSRARRRAGRSASASRSATDTRRCRPRSAPSRRARPRSASTSRCARWRRGRRRSSTTRRATTR